MIQNYQVFGMMCAACASHVENAVATVKGVSSVAVSLLTNSMRVEGDFSTSEVEAAVKRAGYTAKAVAGDKILAPDEQKKTSKVPLILSLGCALLLMIIGMGHMVFAVPSWMSPNENPIAWLVLQMPFALLVAFLNRRYFKGGMQSLWALRPNMDSLIAVGAGASLLYAFAVFFITVFSPGSVNPAKADFSASAMILSLVTLGKTLEGGAKDKTIGAITKLAKLVPDTVSVEKDGKETEIASSALSLSDIVVLRVGDRIPADGKIVSGQITVDESALTGESLPKDLTVGGRVLAGAVVKNGYAKLSPTAIGDTTALSATVRMVSEASATKAPIARLADHVSYYFVPAVMGISLVTFLIFLLTGQGIGEALDRAVSVLVISCPCALGLATPTAMTVAMGRGAELGMLVKDAETMEKLGKIEQVAFDKTGTLTTGNLHVSGIFAVEGKAKDEVLAIAAALEKASTHPIATAVLEEAKDLSLPVMESISTVNGKGLFGKTKTERYMLGNLSLMQDAEVETDVFEAFVTESEARGDGILYLASTEGPLCALSVSDTLKSDAKETICRLHDMKISTLLLSGDTKEAAEKTAEEIGIHRVYAPLLPAEKGEILLREKEKSPLAMVGDGINDAPSLIAVDVGIAMGAGTDIAIESAGAVLRFDKPMDVVNLLRLGRLAMKKIKQNLFFALFYNSICIPLATGVFLPFGVAVTPWMAALAMACSSLTVVTNALSIRRFQPQ